jgi:hypothetical protein
MGHESETSGFDWVNAWAAQNRPDATSALQPAAASAQGTAPFAAARFTVPAFGDDQLMRDIAEIERVRDRLAAMPLAMRRTRAFTLMPSRTTDGVPVAIGGVLALVMLTVFGAAAAMSKLSR